jgi:hypothetical protein
MLMNYMKHRSAPTNPLFKRAGSGREKKKNVAVGTTIGTNNEERIKRGNKLGMPSVGQTNRERDMGNPFRHTLFRALLLQQAIHQP